MSKNLNIALLTGGGDCPGLNAVIRAVAKTSMLHGHKVFGLRNGWAGLLEGQMVEFTHRSVSGLIHKGGTIIGTSRTNVLKDDETVALAFQQFKKLKLDGLVTIGGDGTLTVASKMNEKGMPIVGVPKTIDNDIGKTDYTFGFDTAVSVATEAIDRLHTTAESHNRVMVVEVMGRHAGWIATHAGIAGGADAILIPEFPLSVEEIIDIIKLRRSRGKLFSIIVVAEGAPLIINDEKRTISKKGIDDFGRPRLGGIGQRLANWIERYAEIEARVTVLGYVQRGGTPTARDRVLATRFGCFAANLIEDGKFGMMASLRGRHIEAIPLTEATHDLKTVDDELWDVAKTFFN